MWHPVTRETEGHLLLLPSQIADPSQALSLYPDVGCCSEWAPVETTDQLAAVHGGSTGDLGLIQTGACDRPGQLCDIDDSTTWVPVPGRECCGCTWSRELSVRVQLRRCITCARCATAVEKSVPTRMIALTSRCQVTIVISPSLPGVL